MNRARILSHIRCELRKKKATYPSESVHIRWVERFLDEMAVDYTSQIRPWQIDYFIAKIKRDGMDFEEQLQARSALRFLSDSVHITSGLDAKHGVSHGDSEPGTVRITA
ncbi:MAG: hypothetical protein ACNA78_03635 [Balneolaceae bacterium]